GETEPLLVVANSGQAIFAPAIGPRTRLLMRQIVPGITVRAIILAHRSPLPIAEVWSPQVPALFLRIIFFNPPLFGVHGACCRSHLAKSKSGSDPNTANNSATDTDTL